MTTPEEQLQVQLANIQTKTGKSLAELATLARESGLSKHGELRAMFQEKLGLGYGDANTLVHAINKSDGHAAATAAELTADQVLDGIYAGPKADLRTIHEAVLAKIREFGPFEIAPKKGYVSLRTKKQFAMIGPATNSAIEIGINAKEVVEDASWKKQPSGSMCHYTIRINSAEQITPELIEHIRVAYTG